MKPGLEKGDEAQAAAAVNTGPVSSTAGSGEQREKVPERPRVPRLREPVWAGLAAGQGCSEGEINAQFSQRQETHQGPGRGIIRQT